MGWTLVHTDAILEGGGGSAVVGGAAQLHVSLIQEVVLAASVSEA